MNRYRQLTRREGVAIITAVLMAGCAGWQDSSGPFTDAGLGIEISIPEGWLRIAAAPRDSIILTSNGVQIEAITIQRVPVDRRLPNSRLRFQADMTPPQAADVAIDNRKFAPGITDFQLVSRGSARVDGHDCFRLSYTFRAGFGRTRQVANYGCILGPWLYRFNFSAPSVSFFPEFLPVFEAIVDSARFLPSAGS